MSLNIDVVVVGCGAVGSTVALALARAGVQVAAVTRSGTDGCRWDMVLVEGLGFGELLVCGWTGAARLRPRLVVYAVKAYDLTSAVEDSLQAGWNPEAVVSLQNGLGSLELLSKTYGVDRAIGGVVYFGAVGVAPCRARLLGRGGLLLGCWARGGSCSFWSHQLAEALTAGGLPSSHVGDVEPYRWLKLAVNAAINPVTVLAWSRNKVILENPDAGKLAAQLAREVALVAWRRGVELPGDPVEEVFRVARATGDNCSSMLQDVARRGRSEVDYINGSVAREAWRLGLRAPFNEAMWRAVRLLERWLAGRRLPCEI
ncbi:ketopantoate reductase family protein [Hyperthermus butylicus]|uniref:2-dehydropantoate 2-reductase n=1 Tax=Hyperthermus butylicus (strain DSM 5456 / JCM 9403 / PLM1-5) TaxID=415426 RepID=A2BMY5_HYPBU|nr:2-dehydropantoate 2-reductase [Hyperthermus butylicus]ABM81346.1 Ketopantoate reductase [Hyperthermus butylicus DSM 5456]